MKNINKHKCCICGEIAQWYNENGNKRYQKYYCDLHVPRHSICNVDNLEDFGEPKTNNKIMWWDKSSKSQDLLLNGSLERTEDSFYYEILTNDGRRNPSDDFVYDENGFVKEGAVKMVSNYEFSLAYKKYRKLLNPREKKEFEDVIITAYDDYELKHGNEHEYEIEYNFLMSRIGDFVKRKINKKILLKGYNDKIVQFFNGIKNSLKNIY